MTDAIAATKARWLLGGLVLVATAGAFLALLWRGPTGGLTTDEETRAYRLLGTIYGPLIAQLVAQLGVHFTTDSQTARVSFQSFFFSAIVMAAWVLAPPFLLFTMSPERRIGATLDLLNAWLPWGTTVG